MEDQEHDYDNGHDRAWCLLTNEPVNAHTYKKRKHDQLECVYCDEAHPVFFKQLKHERFYKSACFSHYGTKNSNSFGQSGISSGNGETAEHRDSKFLLRDRLGHYKFLVSRCMHCTSHHTWECGDNATVAIERKVKSNQGNRYFYDACLLREDKPIYALEVFHTHETKQMKVSETKEMGISIAEFTTKDILRMKNLDVTSNEDKIELENLMIDEFTCTSCQLRRAEERDRQHKERIAKQAQFDIEKKQREKEEERLRMERIEEDAKKRKENEIREQIEKEKLSKEHERARRHQEECYARVLWCLHKGGPDFHPAHEHKHRAQGNWCYERKCVVPSNDQNFFYGIPPWHPDGSVNPAGIPGNYGPAEPLGKNFQFLDDYNVGWNCHRCQNWISHPPREYEGKDEPHDWWWCFDCKKSCQKTLSVSEKKIAKVAATCVKINSVFGRARENNDP
tara:strand:+ start:30548 stop:31900 length:1353 start_codon:yes stop_codon:yes gene_type:complete